MILDAHQKRGSRTDRCRLGNRPAAPTAAAAAAEDDGETGKIAVIAGSCCCRDVMPHNDNTR